MGQQHMLQHLTVFLKKKIFFFFLLNYLAALGLSYSMHNLHSSLLHAGIFSCDM